MQTLSALDWSVIAAYILLVGAVGYCASGKQSSTRDYFLGGRAVPWWAAALSIIATETSAVTYIGVPLIAFDQDWSLLQLVGGFVLGRVFLALVFVKVFYRRDYLTVYGVLAHRFGERTRGTAATMFILGRLVASAVRLYAGCLAVHVATGIPITWGIVGLGLFGTLFTYVGGIRAVVWTDVILGLALIAGGLLSVYFLFDAVPGGAATVFSHPGLAGKLEILHWNFDPGDARSLLAGLLGGFVLTLATHGTDQDIAQRMLTCRDHRSGSFSVLGSAVLILPLFALFLSIGTLLYVFHEAGEPPYAIPENRNHLFPVFIVNVLPRGVAGLAMAGLLAAALSSFTSALNAMASSAIADIFRPRGRGSGASQALRSSRLATVFCGLALVLAALAFIGSQDNIFDLAIKVLTYFYGALLGAFLLGILTRRGTDSSVLLGMLSSVPVVLALQVREYVADPLKAPGLIQDLISALPPGASDLIRHVPEIAYPYWIVVGTLICMAIGLMRSRRTSPDRPRRAA